MAIYRLDNLIPDIHESAYIADEASVIGNVSIARQASIWPYAVLRGDNDIIEIGIGTNIQDGSVLHTDDGIPLRIGNRVTVGHQAMLHGCTIGDGTLIGIQAVVLNGVTIGKGCLVAAGAILTEGKTFPDNVLIVGAPARVVRELDDDHRQRILDGAEHYVQKGHHYKWQLMRIG